VRRRDFVRALAAAPLAIACGPNAGEQPRAPAARAPSPSAPPAPPPTAPTAPTAPAATPRAAPAARDAIAPAPGKKLVVLCVAAHPDDAESGCGGTLARYAEAGHDVHVLYVTKGEVGIEGKTPAEAGAIRAAEATKACRILGVTPHFFGHPAGTLVFSWDVARELEAFFDELHADVVFAHWPIDTNYDHEVAGMLAINAWLAKPRAYPLYLFEVESGTQTLGFTPTAYVEIGPVLQKKVAAISAHESQDAERRLYERHHEKMEAFRAREIGGTAAEAFAVLAPDAKLAPLPGL
jgi:LmbE family N-acetylglucosaminyl deacetylase